MVALRMEALPTDHSVFLEANHENNPMGKDCLLFSGAMTTACGRVFETPKSIWTKVAKKRLELDKRSALPAYLVAIIKILTNWRLK